MPATSANDLKGRIMIKFRLRLLGFDLLKSSPSESIPIVLSLQLKISSMTSHMESSSTSISISKISSLYLEQYMKLPSVLTREDLFQGLLNNKKLKDILLHVIYISSKNGRDKDITQINVTKFPSQYAQSLIDWFYFV